jgi:hypothetical protein
MIRREDFPESLRIMSGWPVVHQQEFETPHQPMRLSKPDEQLTQGSRARRFARIGRMLRPPAASRTSHASLAQQ